MSKIPQRPEKFYINLIMYVKVRKNHTSSLNVMDLNFDFDGKVYYLEIICLEVSPLRYIFCMCHLGYM